MVSMKAVSVEGSYVGSLQEMQELMAIARTGVLPDLPLTSQPLILSSKPPWTKSMPRVPRLCPSPQMARPTASPR
jgi:hypothetical protein